MTLSIRGATTGGPTLLGRSDPVLRFVRLRQRFVRRCHEGMDAKRPQPGGEWCRPGQVEQSGSTLYFGPFLLCTRRAEHFLLTSIVNYSWRIICWTRPARAVTLQGPTTRARPMRYTAPCGLRRSHQLAGSGDLLPPSPPAEKATASKDQTWKSGTGDGSRNG